MKLLDSHAQHFSASPKRTTHFDLLQGRDTQIFAGYSLNSHGLNSLHLTFTGTFSQDAAEGEVLMAHSTSLELLLHIIPSRNATPNLQGKDAQPLF